MPAKLSYPASRRSLLRAGAGLALMGMLRPRNASAGGYRIVAAPAAAPLRGEGRASTGVWAYGGTIPGPALRVGQGERIRVVIENQLPEDTTVHWHGIRLPIAMDGVPGISQSPIKPGESFTYDFSPPDAGTFWYHPHADSLQQLGRGLSGVLIVEERLPPSVDRDLVWLLADWRLDDNGRIAGGFGNTMDAMMSGRVGNLATLNGRLSQGEAAQTGERVRLRLINGALARIMALRFEGHRPVVVALDGQPCDPHEPDNGRILLGPAMRVDVMIDMVGDPGRRYSVTDEFYAELGYTLTELVYGTTPLRPSRAFAAPPALPSNPLPMPDLAASTRHELVLQGGMMGAGKMAGLGGMGTGQGTMGMMGSMMGSAGSGMDGTNAAWAINGSSMVGDGQSGMAPLLTLKQGQSCILALRNETAWWHPMHLHGHSFRVLTRNGTTVPHHQWGDTVLLAPRDVVEVAFVADNPGDWMLHCHIMDHQLAGLMGIIRIV